MMSIEMIRTSIDTSNIQSTSRTTIKSDKIKIQLIWSQKTRNVTLNLNLPSCVLLALFPHL